MHGRHADDTYYCTRRSWGRGSLRCSGSVNYIRAHHASTGALDTREAQVLDHRAVLGLSWLLTTS